jgi:2-methylcitrate dehydratase PrpD
VPEPTLVQQLAACAAKASYDVLPADVQSSAPQRVLDILGLSLAALSMDTSDAARGWSQAQTASGPATVIGGGTAPASQAAFVNGVLAHSLDYDDTHLPSVLHPSASVVPAALAAAETSGSSGAVLLAAVTVGVEVVVRLGMAGYDREAGQSTFFERGQHATSICGAVGSAAAAAMLFGLSEEQIGHAMGLSVSMGSGVLEANRNGGSVKRLHCGWAAHAGVMAAELAARGFTAPPTVLEGRFGFFEAWLSGAFEGEEISRDLGTTWALPGIHYKPYPANHFTHAAVDAALRLRAKGVRPEDVTAVEIAVAPPTVRTIGEPIEAKRRPPSGYTAKFSGPFVFAAALHGGGGLGVGLDDFTDERVRNTDLRATMDLTTVVGSQQCADLYPHALPAVVTVSLRDGSTIVEEVLDNRGGPERPLSPDELTDKFLTNATRALSRDSALRLAHDVTRLAELPTAGTALEVLR